MTPDNISEVRRQDAWALKLVIAAVMAAAIGVLVFFIYEPRLRERALVKGAQAAAAAHLRDPSSAQFRNVRVDGLHVCGEINGKNGFGAYAGFVRFHGDRDSAEVDPGDGGPTFYGEPVMKKMFDSSYKIYCES